jgi:hypothetical protein
MTRIEYLRQWQVKLRKGLDKIAHEALSAKLEPASYSERRGRYLQLREMIVVFDEEIKRINGGDEDDAVSEEMPTVGHSDDEDFEPPAVTVRRRATTRRPREWTGS